MLAACDLARRLISQRVDLACAVTLTLLIAFSNAFRSQPPASLRLIILCSKSMLGRGCKRFLQFGAVSVKVRMFTYRTAELNEAVQRIGKKST